MSTKNKMNIIGHLGADPELRYTTSGRAVANLRIATTERWTDKAGTAQEHTEWHRVVAWGNLAEVSAKYLKKGSPFDMLLGRPGLVGPTLRGGDPEVWRLTSRSCCTSALGPLRGSR